MMKNKRSVFIFAVSIICSIQLSAQSPWVIKKPDIFMNYLGDIRIAPDSSIWSVTWPYSGNIEEPRFLFRSPDYGNTWKSHTYLNAHLYDISPIDSLTAYMAFRDSLVKTVDGGATWDRLESMDQRPVSLHFFNEMEGIVFARDTAKDFKYKSIWLTSDGGETWTVMGDSAWTEPEETSLPPEVDSEGIYYFVYTRSSRFEVSGDTILLAKRSGNVWLSKDKGYNWERIQTPLNDLNYCVTSVAMKNTKTFAVAGNFTFGPDGEAIIRMPPIVYSTQDGGKSWSEKTDALVTPVAMEYLPGTGSTIIMTGHMMSGNFGGKGTAASLDFGSSWTLIDNGDFNVWAADFLNDSVGAGFGLSWVDGSIESKIYTWNINDCKVSELVDGCNPCINELSISTNSLSIKAESDSTVSFEITSNTDWTISGLGEWLTASSTSGAGDATITLTAVENTSAESKTDTITISGPCIEDHTLIITQQPIIDGINKEDSRYILIYPNPARHSVFIEGLSSETTGYIYSAIGQLLFREKFKAENGKINVSHLPAGLYFLKLNVNNEVVVKQFVRE